MISITSLLVEGQSQPAAFFGISEMSLSSARSRMTRRTFALCFRRTDAVEQLDRSYAAWVSDCREDQKRYAGAPDELARAGYPSLEAVLDSPSLLKLVVGNYLFRELFDGRTWDGRDPIEYWFDEVTSCTSDGEVIQVDGICYSTGDAPMNDAQRPNPSIEPTSYGAAHVKR